MQRHRKCIPAKDALSEPSDCMVSKELACAAPGGGALRGDGDSCGIRLSEQQERGMALVRRTQCVQQTVYSMLAVW